MTSILVYLFFAPLLLEPDYQVWPLDWHLLSSSVPTRFPVIDPFSDHGWSVTFTLESLSPTSVPSYSRHPLLSATRPGARPTKGLFLPPSALTRLTAQETKVKSSQKLSSERLKRLNDLNVIPERSVHF